MSDFSGTRGPLWFKALAGQGAPMPGDPHSVLTADALIGDEQARFLCVVPDPDGRFPCARRGETARRSGRTCATTVRICAGAGARGLGARGGPPW